MIFQFKHIPLLGLHGVPVLSSLLFEVLEEKSL